VPEFVLMPFERSLVSVDNGVIDADIGRAAGILGHYPNAIETSESILNLHIFAVVKRDFKHTTLARADLKNYRLGHVLGAKIAEHLVNSLGTKAEKAHSVHSLFEMLIHDRFEVALNSSTTPLSMYPAYSGILVTLPQPIYSTKVVHVMNKRWADYVPRIDAAIRTMKADGRMAALLAAAKPL
jgi:ABC-type amino acid transport substrate-binding protein